MKKLIVTLFFCLIFISPTIASEYNSDFHERKIKKTVIDRDFFFSWRLVYSHLSAGENDGLDILGLEGYSRYAFADRHGVNFSMAKFITTEEDTVVENGAIGTRLSVGYTFALTGSLTDKTSIYTVTDFSAKNRKYKIKERTYYKKNDFDGWRVELNIGHMNFNVYDDNLYSFSPSVYYEHRVSKVKLQYGIKYDRAQVEDNDNVDVDFVQGFIGLGFTP